MLFEGPPGTGKTTCARIVASQVEVPLVYIPVESVASKWYGESEKKLGEMLNTAEAMGGCIIFIDEVLSRFCPVLVPCCAHHVIETDAPGTCAMEDPTSGRLRLLPWNPWLPKSSPHPYKALPCAPSAQHTPGCRWTPWQQAGAGR